MSDADNAVFEHAKELVNEISPLLDGRAPEVTRMVLAELVATFIAGHHPTSRADALEVIVKCSWNLVPVIVDEMIKEGRAPDEWREVTKQ
jgi:hypothetical protein